MRRMANRKNDLLKKRKDRLTGSLARSTQTALAELEESPYLPRGMGYFINIMRKVFADDGKDHAFPSTPFQNDEHKKVIGTYCMMVPEELIYAAGAIPVRLSGGSNEAAGIGGELVPRDTCPVVKASVGFTSLDLISLYQRCDVVIIPTTCDAKRKMGEEPDLVIVDHVDYQYGNLHPIRDLSRVAHEHGIPVLCNCAYTLGIMPVDGRKLEVDFIVGSGHKSFSSPAPSGILGIGDEYVERVLSGSRIRGDISGRTYPNKETSILGCTLMGCTAVAMMASFPRVKERVRRWGEEVEKANHFCQQFLRIAGNRVLSEMPRRHTLIRVDTRESFDKIARGHKRKGYFLYEELRNRGITGIFPGATRIWKLNTYGLSWDEVRYLSETFIEIAKKYGIEVQ